jgi:hypothetical protein
MENSLQPKAGGRDRPIPRLLYKYASWQNEYHKRLITHREIFFSSPPQLNDPIDCGINVQYSGDRQEEDALLTRWNSGESLPLGLNQEEQRFRLREQQDRLKTPGGRREFEERQQVLRDRFTGVFCLARAGNSLPMWAYYGHSHSGFCVGYDGQALRKFVSDHAQEDGWLCDNREVKYKKRYPVLNQNDLADQQYFPDQLCVKAKAWQHESEWRFFVVYPLPDPSSAWPPATVGADERRLMLPQGIIKEVILGCRTCDEHKTEIVSFARESLELDVKLFQAKTKVREFGLELVPLS